MASVGIMSKTHPELDTPFDTDVHASSPGCSSTAYPALDDDQPPKQHHDQHLSPRSSSFVQLQTNLLQELWASRAWRLYPIMLLYVSGLTMMAPLTPTLLTNYFASRSAGESLRCEALHPQPPACQNAHSDVVTWSSWCSFASNSLLSVVMMPLVGELTDAYGRKPFLAAAIALAGLPVLVLLLYLQYDFPLLWYYPAQVFTALCSSISVSLALLADVLSPACRAAAFGGLMAAFSMGIIVGPLTGGLLVYNLPNGAMAVTVGALAACTVSVVAVVLCLPETLPPTVAHKARRRLGSTQALWGSTWRAASILMRSSLFRRLTVCLMLSGAVLEGMSELLIQYLQLVADFQPADQTLLFMVFGIAALVVQALVLPWLLCITTERNVLAIGLLSSLCQQVTLALTHQKWIGLLAVAMGSLGSVAFPAISAIKSNNAQEHEQGAVQGALYGARSLAMGVGPLVFAAVFRAFSRSDSGWPTFPGAPFVLGAVVSAVALALAVSLPGAPGAPTLKRDEQGDEERATLLGDDVR